MEPLCLERNACKTRRLPPGEAGPVLQGQGMAPGILHPDVIYTKQNPFEQKHIALIVHV